MVWNRRIGAMTTEKRLVRQKVDTAIRTHDQIACIMTSRGFPMSPQTVRTIEQRALRKIRRALLRDWRNGWHPDDDV
jgi:hypothetical protein